jgi:hypothetical protein
MGDSSIAKPEKMSGKNGFHTQESPNKQTDGLGSLDLENSHHSTVNINIIEQVHISKTYTYQYIGEASTVESVPRPTTEVDRSSDDILDLKSLLADFDESKMTKSHSVVDPMALTRATGPLADRYKCDEMPMEELVAIDPEAYKSTIINRYKIRITRLETDMSKRDSAIHSQMIKLQALRQKKASSRGKILQLIIKLQEDTKKKAKQDAARDNSEDVLTQMDPMRATVGTTTDGEQAFYRYYGNPFQSTMSTLFPSGQQSFQPNTRREDYTTINHFRRTQQTDQFNVSEMQSAFRREKNQIQNQPGGGERPDSPLTACIRKSEQKKHGSRARDRARTEEIPKVEIKLPPMTDEQRKDYDRKMYWKTLLKKKTYSNLLEHTIELGKVAEVGVGKKVREIVEKQARGKIWKAVVTIDAVTAEKEVRYKQISRDKAKEIEISQNLMEQSQSRTSMVDIDSRMATLTKFRNTQSKRSVVSDTKPGEQITTGYGTDLKNMASFGGTATIGYGNQNPEDGPIGNIRIQDYTKPTLPDDPHRPPSTNKTLFRRPTQDQVDLRAKLPMIKHPTFRKGSLSPLNVKPSPDDPARRNSISTDSPSKRSLSLIAIMSGAKEPKSDTKPGGLFNDFQNISKKVGIMTKKQNLKLQQETNNDHLHIAENSPQRL